MRQEKVTIPTYPISAYDKNPMFLEKRVYQGSSGRVYPHPVCEGVSDTKIDREYDAIYLENDYLLVMILPELGGRIQRMYDKTNGYDKIKLVRRHRGLTQQQLGILIDIKNGAANRIAQYETGYRTPKAEIVEKIAKVLNVREETFYMPNDTIVDLIRTLIWYDWEHSLPFQDFGDGAQCFLLRIRLSCSHPAVKALLADWRIQIAAFENGRISSSDYLEWMLQWPPTLSAPDD